MSKILLVMLNLLALTFVARTQELYVFSEPASNMPARSIAFKQAAKLLKAHHTGKLEQRHASELMFGLNKDWMVHVATTFSDMYSEKIRWESGRVYAKYRFISFDEVHRHFRAAVFGSASYSRNNLMFEELSLEGDQSGWQGGVILTQLWNKLAVSSTLGYTQVTTDRPKGMSELLPRNAFDYSLSAGYLVLPVTYTDYRQTNLNVYVELLGQQALDQRRYFVDIAPALQLIFNSNSKLNLGYRIQIKSNMERMAQNRWMIALETTFLNALPRKK